MRKQRNALTALGLALFCAACLAREPGRPSTAPKARPFAVPTFHCLGVYWSPKKGKAGRKVSITYRKAGADEWRPGLPLRYNPVKTPECKGDYRGSLVNLRPGTRYEIKLQLEGTETRARFQAATWSERFPVAEVVKVASRAKTLEVKKSGTPQGYILYDGTGSTIDTRNKSDVGILVKASYVIIRGFTIRNTKRHGIRIWRNNKHYHHVVIENCDISKWGTPDKSGFGGSPQAGVFSNDAKLRAVVIQRCKIHHPSTDSNSWAEKHHTRHPDGPQGVILWECEGNHVIRYNEFWSDKDHYFNDVLGAGKNGSYRGFPGADSDIYGNYIANNWDDGIEAEGGDQNVRIWNNYIEENLMTIGNAAASIGPLYIWRNVSGRSYTPPGSSWNMTHGYFLKMGHAGGDQWMTGHSYIFNNTIFQPNNEGAGGLGGGSKLIKHCVTRNNILCARTTDAHSISTNKASADNDFDYDLLSARYPKGQEKHGISGTPQYVPGAGFSFETKSGNFQLASGSKGLDEGVVIPNFRERFQGLGPDMGAHEAGTPPLIFGVKAAFSPGKPPETPPDAAKKNPEHRSTANPPRIDSAPHRKALRAALQKSGTRKNAEVWLHVMGQSKPVRVKALEAAGLTIIWEGNTLPLAWKDLSDEDVAHLAFTCRNADAESLFHAGLLAAGAGLEKLREKIGYRLLAIDAKKFQELENARNGKPAAGK